jgi:hypothetical protein
VEDEIHELERNFQRKSDPTAKAQANKVVQGLTKQLKYDKLPFIKGGPKNGSEKRACILDALFIGGFSGSTVVEQLSF